MTFPNNFIWGAATASYQIEGAAFKDGKGLSVWDMMCRKKDAIWKNHTGDVTCDHYHRYQQDVSLMKQISLQAYRFSVSWPRVLPNGIGPVNPKGIEFYDKLVDELLKNNIQPYLTIFHWDYPYELYRKGGWLNPASSDWFAEYTALIVDKLSDRVSHWMTLNEPQCFVGGGHIQGRHAPGDKLGLTQGLTVAHNTLLAHGKAVQVIRAHAKSAPQIGFAPACLTKYPVTDTPENIKAAYDDMFASGRSLYYDNSWYMDPIFFGHYPQDGLDAYQNAMPEIGQNDMEIISQPLDFLGVNLYTGRETQADNDGNPQPAPRTPGYPTNSYQWAITPECIYWGTRFMYERYQLPIIITENGLADNDWVALDGKVHDPKRIDYIQRYLLQLNRAIEDNIDIRGYFVWSLMDNFEWAVGFQQRFGLIHIDYQTLQRTIKDSAYWYQKVIQSNGQFIGT